MDFEFEFTPLTATEDNIKSNVEIDLVRLDNGTFDLAFAEDYMLIMNPRSGLYVFGVIDDNAVAVKIEFTQFQLETIEDSLVFKSELPKTDRLHDMFDSMDTKPWWNSADTLTVKRDFLFEDLHVMSSRACKMLIDKNKPITDTMVDMFTTTEPSPTSPLILKKDFEFDDEHVMSSKAIKHLIDELWERINYLEEKLNE